MGQKNNILKIGQPKNYMSLYDFKWIKTMKSWTKFLGEKTQSNHHRAKGLLGTYSQTKMRHFVLLFFIACKGPRVVWDVLFDLEQE
jgi:hypothetical protein